MAALKLYYIPVLEFGAWDFPIMIDGAWRMSRGVVPHGDFASPLGPLAFFFQGIAIAAFGPTMHSYHIGVVVFASALTIPIIWTMRCRQWNPYFSACFVLLAASYALTPRSVNLRYFDLGMIGSYNAMSVALMSLVVLIATGALTTIKREESSHRLEHLMLGATVGSLVFLKYTFAIAALPLALVGLFSGPKVGKALAHTAKGFLGASFFWLAVCRFNVFGLVRDWTIPLISFPEFVRSDDALLGRLKWLIRSVDLWSLGAVAIAVLIGGIPTILKSPLPRGRAISRCSFAAVALFAAREIAEFVTSYGITHERETFFASFVIVGMLAECTRSISAPALWHRMVISGIFGALATAATAWYSFENVWAFTELHRANQVESRKLLPQNYGFSDLIFGVKSDFSRKLWEEGAEIVAEHSKADQSIMTVAWPNFLSPMLSRPPYRGAPLYWHLGISYSNAAFGRFPTYFDPPTILKTVDVIAIPTIDVHRQNTPPFRAQYGAVLANCFARVPKGQLWEVYVKKPDCALRD